MRAMLLQRPAPVDKLPLELVELPPPEPGADEVLVRVRACGVCHTDLHVVEGEIAAKLPIVPGHQIVGVIERVGPNVEPHPQHETGLVARGSALPQSPEIVHVGDRVGVPWLHRTCGACGFCRSGRENLCERAQFTGFHVHGGYAEFAVAPAGFVVSIPGTFDDVHAAPLLCAGIVGFRALRLALVSEGCALGRPPGDTDRTEDIAKKDTPGRVAAGRLGLYGFGASAHVVLQIAAHWQCEVFVATRGAEHQRLARRLGAAWVGRAEEIPNDTLDAAVIFAPAGALVPEALRALRKGGTLVLGGIYMTPIPELKYELLYHERIVRSVTNATRADARQFMRIAAEIPVRTEVETFPLESANDALAAMKHSRLRGAAVLVV